MEASTLGLPPGFTARPATLADAEAVAGVISADRAAYGDASPVTTDEVAADWDEIDVAEQTLVICGPDGGVVANADILNRRYMLVSVYGNVHPQSQGRGLGAALVRWGQRWTRDRFDRAPAESRIAVQHYVDGSNRSARDLLQAHEYAHVRTIYIMAIHLDSPPAPPMWPKGIGVDTFVPGEDDRAVYETGEDAFRDMWDRPPGTLESWMAATRSEGFDPTLWFLARERDTGEVTGLCLSQIASGRGWVRTLAVRRTWRGRGIALALLLHAFGELERRGVREIGLSVDSESPTGAPKLYTRAGMHVDREYVIYRKEVRPGLDFSTIGS